MTPYLADPDFTLIHADVIDGLRSLPDESVHCVVTSPPYWGLRDYGTGLWDGGNPDCDHRAPAGGGAQGGSTKSGLNAKKDRDGRLVADNHSHVIGAQFRDVCRRCGARRIDQQLGLEPTPDLYVARMVEVFREVWRVLRRDGTCWLNMGDSYAQGASGSRTWDGGKQGGETAWVKERGWSTMAPGLKPKDLIGMPWRLAFALQQPYYAGRITDERDRIWLAAMVEAEGCMFIHRRKAGQANGQGYQRKSDSYGSGLEVSSTDRVIVERCCEIAGAGSVCEQSPTQNDRRKQTLYRWNLRTNECRDVVRELYPHLVAKQHEARLLIGCPSSGDDARKAWESLKALHQGQSACIDFIAPESLFEAGWFLRSDVIWAKLCPIRCPSR